MSSGARNKQVIRKSTRKYGIFHITCFSITQGCKNSVVHSHCATKNLGKNIFKPSLQNGSQPNFHYRCICGRQNCGAVVKICRPVLPNFSHWTALSFCTAFQNFPEWCGQACNQGKHLGHSHLRKFQNIPQQFWHLQKLLKDKDEILFCNHF